MPNLTPEKALIFRITHIANVPWILANGLHCANSDNLDPSFVEIGNPELIAKRPQCRVPIEPGGTLSDYVPFYFTPFSPMLLNLKTGFRSVIRRPMDEIAILVSSLPEARKRGVRFVFTDSHAYLRTAQFYNDLGMLDRIDWRILQARDFKRDPEDPGKFERYQAEALIHRHLPVSGILGVVCHGKRQQERLLQNCDNLGLTMQVLHKPGWYV